MLDKNFPGHPLSLLCCKSNGGGIIMCEGERALWPGVTSREKISRLPDCCLPVVRSTLYMTVHTCQSQSSDFSRLATTSDSRLESETTDRKVPASRTACPMPAWPHIHAKAQNEATLQLTHAWRPLAGGAGGGVCRGGVRRHRMEQTRVCKRQGSACKSKSVHACGCMDHKARVAIWCMICRSHVNNAGMLPDLRKYFLVTADAGQMQ
eukprot:scaffold26860_cov62-Cyclotella_meneghiniana.AAC.1